MMRNSKSIKRPAFQSKFNALTNTLKLSSFQALLYNAVFAVRRFDLILVNLFLNDGSPLSGCDRTFFLEKILLFFTIQTIYLCYIHKARPHHEPMFNRLEFINEYTLCLFGYSMLILVQGISNRPEFSEDQEKYGRTLAFVLIMFIFISNMYLVLKDTFFKVKLKAKGCLAKNQNSPKVIWCQRVFSIKR